MKKLGKKVSFLTKILLVVGLLISNLSSLSVVFAYEVTGNVLIELSDDDSLKISYSEKIAEDVEAVNVKVYENYTYLDGFSEEDVEVYSLTDEQMQAALEGKLELVHKSIFASEEIVTAEGEIATTEEVRNIDLFDGTYNVKVEIIDVTESVLADETEEVLTDTTEVVEGTLIDYGTYKEDMLHQSGLAIKLLDETGAQIEVSEDGSYSVSADNSKVKVVTQILSGGLKPTDIFVYNNVEYIAADLLKQEFSFEEVDFAGRLFGEYVLPVEIKLLNSDNEEVTYSKNINIIYESYEMNAGLLNSALVELELGESYQFNTTSENGVVYVLLNEDRANTMLDLYELMQFTVGEDDLITYILSNSQYEDVLSTYDETTSELTLEEYLDTILLDDTAVLSLMNDGLTITFKVVIAADLNNDNVLTEDDLLELVEQVVGNKETDTLKADLVGLDGTVDTLDVMYLDQIIKTNVWGTELVETEATLDAELKVNGENLVSGDEFTIGYVLSLTDAVNGFAGVFKYDENLFELVSLETSEGWVGSYNAGKFLYLANESLTGTVTETETGETVVTPVEHVIVTATFRTLGATSEDSNNVITLEEIEIFNSTSEEANYLVLDNTILSTEEIIVTASDDNTLSYLEVAGQEITLEEGKFEYEITVSNEVTLVDLKYILGNVAANVTSTVFPEELVEGNNTVVVTITSESGISQDYTITVVREEAPEEETTTQVNYNNNYNDNYEDDKEEVVTPEEPEENDDEEEPKEESNLSRIVIIILILLVIAGLIYLIFKDDDDEETKKANKAVNRLKKEDVEPKVTTNNKSTKDNKDSKNNNSKNKKKER